MVRLNDQFLAFRQSIDTNLAEAKMPPNPQGTEWPL